MSHVSEVSPSVVQLPSPPAAPAVDHAARTGRRGRHRRRVAGRAVSGTRLRTPPVPRPPRRAVDRVPGPGAAPAARRSIGAPAARAAATGARQVVRGGGQPAPAGREARRRDHLAGAPRAGGAGARRGRRAAAVGRGPRRAAGDGVARAAAGRDRADRQPASSPGSPRWRWLWNHRATPRRSTNAWRARNRRAGASGRCSPARWYRAAGQLPESAMAYLAASAAAGPRDDGAADLLAAIDVLRATDDGARALQVIEQAIARWPADRRLLARAVDLALAQNDARRAQSFGARLVALAPGDDPVLSRQLDLDLAVGDNEAALRTLSALVERRPDDESLRRRLAQIATWANRPQVALAAWTLARRARRARGERESARARPGALRAQVGHRAPRGEGAASRLEARGGAEPGRRAGIGRKSGRRARGARAIRDRCSRTSPSTGKSARPSTSTWAISTAR